MAKDKDPKTAGSPKAATDNLLAATKAASELMRNLKASFAFSELTKPSLAQQSIANALREMDGIRKLTFDNPAARLAEELQKTTIKFADLKVPTLSINTGIAEELARLQETFRVFQPDPKILSIGRQIAEASAVYQEQFKAISVAFSSATEALRSFGEPLQRLVEDEAVAEFIVELGFVPHGELWEYVADIEKSEPQDTFSERLIIEIWPSLRKKLELTVEECLGDAKLHGIFTQMLRSFEVELYELTLTGVPTLLERAVLIARCSGNKTKTFEWIKTEVSGLPLEYVGGIRGYRLWKILLDHTFAGVWTDAEADAIKFPNRHASAHGIGARTASKVDSVNSILLCHFVITIAKAVVDHRNETLS